jgi:tight adherence protein C
MLELLTAALFVLVAAVTAWAGLRAGAWRVRGVYRLAPLPARAMGFMPSPALFWRELVSRLGSAVPASARDLPRLKRRLIRAGFRNPNAARYFQGVRLVTPLLFAAAALAAAWQSHAPLENLILGTGTAAAIGYVAPMQYVLLRIRRRQHAIARGLPNALDLMVVCVESGLGIDQTLLQVAKELQRAHPEISSEFTLMNLDCAPANGALRRCTIWPTAPAWRTSRSWLPCWCRPIASEPASHRACAATPTTCEAWPASAPRSAPASWP